MSDVDDGVTLAAAFPIVHGGCYFPDLRVFYVLKQMSEMGQLGYHAGRHVLLDIVGKR